MQLSQPCFSKFQALLSISITTASLVCGTATAGLAKAVSTAPAQSKTAGVEVTEGSAGSQVTEGGDKRAQLLNDVVAPSYQTTTPEAARVKQEIMDDLEHKSEPEPFCYYPI